MDARALEAEADVDASWTPLEQGLEEWESLCSHLESPALPEAADPSMRGTLLSMAKMLKDNQRAQALQGRTSTLLARQVLGCLRGAGLDAMQRTVQGVRDCAAWAQQLQQLNTEIKVQRYSWQQLHDQLVEAQAALQGREVELLSKDQQLLLLQADLEAARQQLSSRAHGQRCMVDALHAEVRQLRAEVAAREHECGRLRGVAAEAEEAAPIEAMLRARLAASGLGSPATPTTKHQVSDSPLASQGSGPEAQGFKERLIQRCVVVISSEVAARDAEIHRLQALLATQQPRPQQQQQQQPAAAPNGHEASSPAAAASLLRAEAEAALARAEASAQGAAAALASEQQVTAGLRQQLQHMQAQLDEAAQQAAALTAARAERAAAQAEAQQLRGQLAAAEQQHAAALAAARADWEAEAQQQAEADQQAEGRRWQAVLEDAGRAHARAMEEAEQRHAEAAAAERRAGAEALAAAEARAAHAEASLESERELAESLGEELGMIQARLASLQQEHGALKREATLLGERAMMSEDGLEEARLAAEEAEEAARAQVDGLRAELAAAQERLRELQAEAEQSPGPGARRKAPHGIASSNGPLAKKASLGHSSPARPLGGGSPARVGAPDGEAGGAAAAAAVLGAEARACALEQELAATTARLQALLAAGQQACGEELCQAGGGVPGEAKQQQQKETEALRSLLGVLRVTGLLHAEGGATGASASLAKIRVLQAQMEDLLQSALLGGGSEPPALLQELLALRCMQEQDLVRDRPSHHHHASSTADVQHRQQWQGHGAASHDARPAAGSAGGDLAMHDSESGRGGWDDVEDDDESGWFSGTAGGDSGASGAALGGTGSGHGVPTDDELMQGLDMWSLPPLPPPPQFD